MDAAAPVTQNQPRGHQRVRKLLIAGTAVVLVICVYIVATRIGDPLRSVSGLNVESDETKVFSQGRYGKTMYLREVTVRNHPETVRKAIARAVGDRAGWSYRQYRTQSAFSNYGTFVGLFEKVSYEVTLQRTNELGIVRIEVMRPATTGEIVYAKTASVFSNLFVRSRS